MSKLKYVLPLIGIMLGGTLYHGFTLLIEPHPIESFKRTVSIQMNDRHVTVTNPDNVVPGQSVIITSEVVRAKDGCSSTIRRSWYDSNGNVFVDNDVYRQGLVAGPENYFSDLLIPPTVPHGTLRLRTEVEFYCNPVQKLLGRGSVLNLPDIFFQVVK
jgi:hypothetical protein